MAGPFLASSLEGIHEERGSVPDFEVGGDGPGKERGDGRRGEAAGFLDGGRQGVAGNGAGA